MTKRRWLWVLVILLLLRSALPYALRPIVASQASEALRARVEIGDLDLALWRGGVALEDVSVRRADEPLETTEPPLVGWKRFAVSLRYLPLLRKTIQLRRVELESPRVALDRLESGDLNVLALIPATEEKPASSEPAETGSAWKVGIDRFVLSQGGVRFRDFVFEDAEPVEVSLGAIEVTEIALAPGVYGEPARLHVEVKVDQGRLAVDSRLVQRADGVDVHTDLKARRLPLRRTRVYTAGGATEFRGLVDAAVTHEFVTGGRHDVRGMVIVNDLTVRVPGLDEPGLAWKRLAVRVDQADLVAQRVDVRTVELSGARLVMRTAGDEPLPVLRAMTREEPAAAAEPAEPAPPAAEAKPWHWSVASLVVKETDVVVLGPEGPVEVGIDLAARRLSDEGDDPGTLKLALTTSDGRIDAEGALRAVPPGYDGTVRIEHLTLPALVVAGRALAPGVLQSGVLSGDLVVAAGALAPAPGDVRVRGALALAEPRLAAEDPKEFAVGAKAIDVHIEGIDVPGVLATAPAARGPIAVRLRDLRIDTPDVQLTRAPEGLVLPPFSGAPAGKEGEPAGEAAPADAPPATTLPTTAPPAAAAPAAGQPTAPAPVDLTIATFRLDQGRIAVTDRAVKPFYATELKPLQIEMQQLRWPTLAVASLRLDASSPPKGKLTVRGAYLPSGGNLDLDVRDLALLQFNPYATSYSPYSVKKGALTVATKATFAGDTIGSTTKLSLLNFDLGSRAGDSVFQEQFGMPLTLALALLRDVHGNIILDIPVESGKDGTKIGLGTVIGGALRRAFVNALASPLKLAGAAFGGGGAGAVAPTPIAFRPGRATLASDADEQVAQLGELLASRPGIGVTLTTAPSEADVRWLREQALAKEFASAGILGAVRGLPQRGARERIKIALEARANDEPGPLEDEDTAQLDRWLDERPKPTPEALRALAAERIALVAKQIGESRGIPATRIVSQEPAAELTSEPPAVAFELGAV